MTSSINFLLEKNKKIIIDMDNETLKIKMLASFYVDDVVNEIKAKSKTELKEFMAIFSKSEVNVVLSGIESKRSEYDKLASKIAGRRGLAQSESRDNVSMDFKRLGTRIKNAYQSKKTALKI